ncbi:UNVERIFIED_CONTAM: hypothetical protein FKN15_005678 [Acipenser sinensis]
MCNMESEKLFASSPNIPAVELLEFLKATIHCRKKKGLALDKWKDFQKILLSVSDNGPFGIARLVCIGCAEDMCKYWCMSVGLQKRPFGIARLVCIGCAEDMCKYWCMSVGLQKSIA